MTPPRHVQSSAQSSPRRAVVWLTGLSGAGKSTIAFALERELTVAGRRVRVLDGDALRHGLNEDLGFSRSDRGEQVRRTAHVARLCAEAGLDVIVALISPYRGDRRGARRVVEHGHPRISFLEVYVSTPLAVCEHRDPKGLYALARAGLVGDFTGISAPFEPPDSPDVVLDTSTRDLADAVQVLLKWVVAAPDAPERSFVSEAATAQERV